MKIFKTCLLILTIFLNNWICAFETTCLTKIFQLFVNETTIYIISEDLDQIPLQINNIPLILAKIENPIKLSSKFYGSYIIYTDGEASLKKTLNKIKASSIWNKNQSPRGTFFVITANPNLKNIFEILWVNDIINVIIINGAKLYTSDPFSNGNNCGNSSEVIFSETCDSMVKFNKTVKNVNGCLLQLSNVLTTTRIKESPTVGFLWEIFALISEKLNSNNVGGFEMKNEEVAHQNPSEGILFSFRITREAKDMDTFDFSNIYYYDKLVWAVPKPNKNFGVRILFIYKKAVWLLILSTFLLEVLAWWLIAAKDLDNYHDFWRCLIANYAFLLGQADNLTPKTRALKFLALFFMLYCIVISVSSQANLTCGLTNPSYERGITTLEELSQSDLTLLSTGHAKELITDKSKEGYPKLLDHIVVPKRLNQTAHLATLVEFRNISTLLGQKSVKVCLPPNSAVNVIDAHLLVMEVTLGMRIGHFFMPTLNKLLRLLQEHGFNDKIMRDVNRQTGFVESNTVYPLKVNHLHGPFLCWCVGLLFASVTFVLELLRKREPK